MRLEIKVKGLEQLKRSLDKLEREVKKANTRRPKPTLPIKLKPPNR